MTDLVIAAGIFFLSCAFAALVYAGSCSAESQNSRAVLHRLGYGGPLPRRPAPNPDKAEHQPVSIWRDNFALRYFANAIAQAGLELQVHTLIATIFLLFIGSFAGLAAWLHWTIALLCSAGVASLPIYYLRVRANRRMATFNQQLPYVLDLLRSALESGHTLLRALQMATENLPDPVASELRKVVEQVQVGMPLSTALDHMYRRVPQEDVGFIAVSVRIQSVVGSSLAEIIDHASQSVRNRQRLHDQIRTLTAQSRASAFIVTILPLVVLGIFTLVRPGYAWPLFHDPTGIRLLETAIVFDGLAFMAMRRIAKIEY